MPACSCPRWKLEVHMRRLRTMLEGERRTRVPYPFLAHQPHLSEMEKIQQQFANFCIAQRSTLTEDSTYLLDIDISKSKREKSSQFLAISCSNNSLRLYNRDTFTLIREYTEHPGRLSGIRFAHTNENLLFSACSDGTVKCWDTRSPNVDAVQLFNGFPSNVFISLDVNCNDVLLCAGTEKVEDDAFIVFWDTRFIKRMPTSKEPMGVYSESHNDDITQVCFHPTSPNLLVSGSTDGLVNVFDLNKENEDDALLATCNSDSSVSFIGWSGKIDNQMYCLTHDEGFCWWDLAHLDTQEPITLLKIQDVRETFNTACGNLDYLTGGFYNKKVDTLFILGGTHTGTIHLMKCGTSGLHHCCTLQGGHSSTLRSFNWNHEEESLLTGGEDAHLVLWKPRPVNISITGKDTMKIASAVHQRVRIHNNKSYKNKQRKVKAV